MKRIIVILIIGFVFSNVQAQMDNPLKEGMSNTVTLNNGNVIYDLTGEWNAAFDSGGWGKFKNVVKFTQKEDQFSGIVLNGIRHLDRSKEAFKGKLKGSNFDTILFYDAIDFETMNLFWAPSEGSISEDGNTIFIKRIMKDKGSTTIRSWTLKRK
jgi:hypothetical protein